MNDKTIKLCPECGKVLAGESLLGLCPECLLQAGLETQPPPMSAPEAGQPGSPARVSYFGDYELLEEVARGGMGVVWKARQVSLNRVVAVKMILSGRLAGTAEVKRFRTEAEAAAKLQHPNIVAIHEVGEHEGQHYFSMDFVEGQSLAEMVFHRPLPAEQAAKYLRTIAEAIHYAHQRGVLHRDLKPSNVLIDRAGQPRVTDFGLAKMAETDSGLTHSGAVMGSPSYMSPEQASGKTREVGPAADIYALGAVLYELITGRPPFQAATPLDTMRMVVETDAAAPRWVNPAIPVDLETICLKCLEKDPHRRYMTAQDLADDLRRFLHHEPVVARPSTRVDRALKWVRRNPRVSFMGVLLAAVVVVGFAAVGWQLRQTRAALRLAEQNSIAEATARAPVLSSRLVMAHSNGAVSAVFSPDGRRILSASHDGTANIWDGSSGQQLSTLSGHDGSLGPAQFSADGRRVLTFGGDTQHRYPKTTPSGQRTLVSTSLRYGDQTVRLWDAETGRQLLFITNAADQISDAALSPDGTRIVTSSLDGVARIWDASTGSLLHTLTGHVASVRSARFSPDGRRVLTTSHGTKYNYTFTRTKHSSGSSGGSMSVHEDFIAGLWDAASGAPLGRLQNAARVGPFGLFGSESSHTVAAFSLDGQWIVTAAAALDNIGIWDARTGKMKRRLQGHTHEVNAAVFSPDGTRVLTASADHTARLWDARHGTELAVFRGHEGPVIDAAFSPDGKRIATTSGDGTARIWEPSGRGIATLRGHEGKVFTVSFSPDGAHVVTAGEDGTVRLWDAATLEQLAIPLVGHSAEVNFIQFSPDGRRVVTASQDHSARVWDTADGRFLRELKGLAGVKNKNARRDALGPVQRAVFSPDGTTIAATSDDQHVVLVSPFTVNVSIRNWPPPGELLPFFSTRLYDVATGAEKLGFNGDDCGADVVAFSPDGSRLVTGSTDRIRRAAIATTGGTRSGSSGGTGSPIAAHLWNARSGELIATLPGHNSRVNFIAFSPDGRRILTGDARKMRLWDAATGTELVQFEKPAQAVYGEFSPNSQLVLGNDWGTAALWDANTGQQVLRFKPQSGQVSCATFSPDGKLVLIGGRYGTASICEAVNGEPVCLPFTIGKPVNPAMTRSDQVGFVQGIFSPDGRLVATLDGKGTGRIWDVSSRRPAALLLATLKGHKAEIRHMAFSPDGRWLGTASKDYTARLWPVSAMVKHFPGEDSDLAPR